MREFRGISQAKLAAAIGISVPTLYRLENDDSRVDVNKIARAAKELNLEFDWAARTIKLPVDLPKEAFSEALSSDDRWQRLILMVNDIAIAEKMLRVDVLKRAKAMVAEEAKNESADYEEISQPEPAASRLRRDSHEQSSSQPATFGGKVNPPPAPPGPAKLTRTPHRGSAKPRKP